MKTFKNLKAFWPEKHICSKYRKRTQNKSKRKTFNPLRFYGIGSLFSCPSTWKENLYYKDEEYGIFDFNQIYTHL